MLDFYRDLAVEAVDSALNAEDGAVRNDAREALEHWDGRIAGDSRGVPLLMHFRRNLRSTLLAPFFAACLRAEPLFKFSWRSTEYVVRCLVATRDKLLLPGSPESDWSTRVANVLYNSARKLRDAHARPVSELRWEDMASRSLSHPLSRRIDPRYFQKLPLPADGDDDCVYVNTSTLTVCMRLVVSPGREEEAVLTMPGGQSESTISKHYRDQHQVWCAQVTSPLRDLAPRIRRRIYL
jgi:penicillin amidase